MYCHEEIRTEVQTNWSKGDSPGNGQENWDIRPRERKKPKLRVLWKLLSGKWCNGEEDSTQVEVDLKEEQEAAETEGITELPDLLMHQNSTN